MSNRKILRVERIPPNHDNVLAPQEFQVRDKFKKFEKVIKGVDVEEFMRAKRIGFFFVKFGKTGTIEFLAETYEQDWA